MFSPIDIALYTVPWAHVSLPQRQASRSVHPFWKGSLECPADADKQTGHATSQHPQQQAAYMVRMRCGLKYDEGRFARLERQNFSDGVKFNYWRVATRVTVGLTVGQKPHQTRGKKGKVFPYSLPSVGPGADPCVHAVSPQVT